MYMAVKIQQVLIIGPVHTKALNVHSCFPYDV